MIFFTMVIIDDLAKKICDSPVSIVLNEHRGYYEAT